MGADDRWRTNNVKNQKKQYIIESGRNKERDTGRKKWESIQFTSIRWTGKSLKGLQKCAPGKKGK